MGISINRPKGNNNKKTTKRIEIVPLCWKNEYNEDDLDEAILYNVIMLRAYGLTFGQILSVLTPLDELEILLILEELEWCTLATILRAWCFLRPNSEEYQLKEQAA